MKLFKMEMRYVFGALLTLTLGVFGTTQAAGTQAGTTVVNQASVDYDVGGVDQTDILSDGDTGTAGVQTTDFLVDRLLDFTVTEVTGDYNHTGALSPAPGDTEAVIAWTVQNDGNDDYHDFTLSAAATATDPHGGTDNFDVSAFTLYVDVNGNGTYESATDTATFIDELAADDSIVVFMVGTIPATQVDGDIAAYDLTVQIAEGNGGTTGGPAGAAITSDDSAVNDDPAVEQDVFGSGLSATGTVTDADAYQVVSADLVVTKTSEVLDDPLGAVSPLAKAIPGAHVEYCILVDNATGTADADNVIITDDISAEIAAGTIDFYAGQYGGNDIELTETVGGTPTTTNLTAAVDLDDGKYNDGGDETVTVENLTIAAGDSAEVCFQVTIQ